MWGGFLHRGLVLSHRIVWVLRVLFYRILWVLVCTVCLIGGPADRDRHADYLGQRSRGSGVQEDRGGLQGATRR